MIIGSWWRIDSRKLNSGKLGRMTQEELAKHIHDHVLAKDEATLYKFRTIESALRIINEGTLMFSTPLKFNDPFDCQLTIDASGDLPAVAEHLFRLRPDTPRQELERMAAVVVGDQSQVHRFVNDSLVELLSETGLCCFCRTWEPILIWAYYAQDHQGVTLGFDPAEDPLFAMRLKVSYVTQYPIRSFWTREADLILEILTTKYKLWEHEQEIRVLHDPPGAKKFRPEALREITFGCRCDPADRVKVMEACRANGLQQVKFYQAEKIPFRYALSRVELRP